MPPVARWHLPPLYPGRQPRNRQFAALMLAGGATGVSYVPALDAGDGRYHDLRGSSLAVRDPGALARDFGSPDPVQGMLALAAMNAMCAHVVHQTGFVLDAAMDSLGMLDIRAGDQVGMVGLFARLVPRIQQTGAGLVIVELREELLSACPHFPLTLDPTALRDCNKVLCTSTIVCNHTFEEILSHCDPAAQVAMTGPTAGYFPDPLFRRRIHVFGGTHIHAGERFMDLVEAGEPWGAATCKFCLRREAYAGHP